MAHSYHCLCSNFILASVHDLSKVSRRNEEAADRAYVLPVHDESDKPRTILDGVVKAREPMVIQREDGLEKRWLVNCDRCDLPIGYHLDWLQMPEEDVEGKKREGRQDKVLYVLPGALITTEDMREGKKPPQNHIKLKVGSV